VRVGAYICFASVKELHAWTAREFNSGGNEAKSVIAINFQEDLKRDSKGHFHNSGLRSVYTPTSSQLSRVSKDNRSVRTANTYLEYSCAIKIKMRRRYYETHIRDPQLANSVGMKRGHTQKCMK